MVKTGVSMLLAAATVMLSVAAPARAETDAATQAMFDELFGNMVREVQITRQTDDDVALAQRMVNAADNLKDSKALRVLIYERAFDLASGSDDGFDLALQAVGKAVRLAPDRRSEFDDMVIRAHNLRFRRASRDDRTQVGRQMIGTVMGIGDRRFERGDYRGAIQAYRQALPPANILRSPQRDEINEAMRLAKARLSTSHRIDMLASRLDATPKSTQLADQLVTLLVVEMDNPSAAKAYAGKTSDEKTADLVAMANKPLQKLTEDEAYALAEWYETLAEEATPDARPVMLDRTREYLERYLELHEGDDVYAVRARLKLEDLARTRDQKAGNASGLGSDAGRTIDLLRLTDADKDTVYGKWVKHNGQLAASGDRTAMIRFPVRVTGSYRLALRIAVDFGSARYYDELRIRFPTGPESNSYFEMPFGGYYYYYNVSPKLGVAQQPRMLATSLPINKPSTYVIEVHPRGDKVGIAVSVNGKRLCQWQGARSEVKTRKRSKAHVSNPGVYFSGFSAAVQKAQLQVLSGEARRERE